MTIQLPEGWGNSAIGCFELYCSDRLKIEDVIARVFGAFPIAVSCQKLNVFRTKKGYVTPHLYVILVAKSGYNKTPLIKLIRRIIRNWNKKALSVSKFTTQGLSDYIGGKAEIKDKEGTVIKEAIVPHPAITMVRDECTRTFKDASGHFRTDLLEFLSEAHDDEYEGDITRSGGLNEGGNVYLNYLGASTEYLFKVLPNDFFMQGLGNKFVLLKGESKKRERNTSGFFIEGGQDLETDKLIDNYKKVMTDALNVNDCYLDENTKNLWLNFEYEWGLKSDSTEGFEGSFLSKIPLLVLRLAILYTVNMRHVVGGVLHITKDCMQLAIQDGLSIIEHRQKIIMWNKKIALSKIDEPMKSSVYNIEAFVMYAIQHGGYCSTTEIKAEFGCSNVTLVTNTLELGIDKKWLTVYANTACLKKLYSDGKVKEEFYNRFKVNAGMTPAIYKVTDEGYVAMGYSPTKEKEEVLSVKC